MHRFFVIYVLLGITVVIFLTQLIQVNTDSRFTCQPMHTRASNLTKHNIFPCRNDTSQHNIYRYVHENILHMKYGGTYVEIGAMGGNWLSNTLRLHTCFNWTGILVEASPHNYQKLVKNTKKMRAPPVQIFFGAVCHPPQTRVKFSTRFGATAGVLDYMSESYKSMHYKNNQSTVFVPCEPMSKYLHGMDRINFFSLDVEGAELIVLQTIDFSKIHIDVFVIEMDQHDKKRNNDIRVLLKTKGYIECISTQININYIFVHEISLHIGCVSCGKQGRVINSVTPQENSVVTKNKPYVKT